jgi:hypothetical protein
MECVRDHSLSKASVPPHGASERHGLPDEVRSNLPIVGVARDARSSLSERPVVSAAHPALPRQTSSFGLSATDGDPRQSEDQAPLTCLLGTESASILAVTVRARESPKQNSRWRVLACQPAPTEPNGRRMSHRLPCSCLSAFDAPAQCGLKKSADPGPSFRPSLKARVPPSARFLSPPLLLPPTSSATREANSPPRVGSAAAGGSRLGGPASAPSVPPVLRIRFAREWAAAQRAPLRSLQRTTESRAPKIRLPARSEPRAFRRPDRERRENFRSKGPLRESAGSERPLGTRQPAFLLTTTMATTTAAASRGACSPGCRATMPLLPPAQPPAAGPRLFSYRSSSPS